MEEESIAIELALENHYLFFFVCAVQENVSITVRQFYSYFGSIVTLLTLDSVVIWSLMMR